MKNMSKVSVYLEGRAKWLWNGVWIWLSSPSAGTMPKLWPAQPRGPPSARGCDEAVTA